MMVLHAFLSCFSDMVSGGEMRTAAGSNSKSYIEKAFRYAHEAVIWKPPGKNQAYKLSIFGIIPSVTYNIRF